MKKVQEVMSREVSVIRPTDTLQEAARAMARLDVGSLPVCDGERILGMVTDRDIVLRAVAEGKGPETSVEHAMSRDVKFVYDDEDIDDVAETMAELQVRRLPVLSREKRLVGIVSLGDVSRVAKAKEVGETLRDVSQPGHGARRPS